MRFPAPHIVSLLLAILFVSPAGVSAMAHDQGHGHTNVGTEGIHHSSPDAHGHPDSSPADGATSKREDCTGSICAECPDADQPVVIGMHCGACALQPPARSADTPGERFRSQHASEVHARSGTNPRRIQVLDGPAPAEDSFVSPTAVVQRL